MIFLDYLYYRIHRFYTEKLNETDKVDIPSVVLLSVFYGFNTISVYFVIKLSISLSTDFFYYILGINGLYIALNFYRYFNVVQFEDLAIEIETNPPNKLMRYAANAYFIISLVVVFSLMIHGAIING